MKEQDWIMLGVNLLLVLVTAAYVILTWSLAKSAKASAVSAREAAKYTKDAAEATRRQAELTAGAYRIAFEAVLWRPLDEHSGDPNDPKTLFAGVFAELDPEIGSKRELTITNAGGRVYFHKIGGFSIDFVPGKGGREANAPSLQLLIGSDKPRYFDSGTPLTFVLSPIAREVEIHSMSINVYYTLEPGEELIRTIPVSVEIVRRSGPSESK